MSAVMYGGDANEQMNVTTPEGLSFEETEGVGALVALLKQPGDAIRAMTSNLASLTPTPVDWDGLADLFRDFFRRNSSSAMQAYLKVRLALGILRANDVDICNGPANIWFWEDEACDAYVSIELSVDTDGYRAHLLREELRELIVNCAAVSTGFLVSYKSVHPYDPAHWPAPPPLDPLDDEDEE